MPQRSSSRHPNPPTRGISYLSLVLYGIRMTSIVHAGKGSILGAGVSNVMIPPIIDYFHAWKPLLCHKEPAKGKKCP